LIDRLSALLERLILSFANRQKAGDHTTLPVAHGFGIDVDSREAIDLSPADLRHHAYVLGATGCGKTTLILKLVAEDLKHGHSLVIIDLRGDLVQGVLALCEQHDIEPERVTLLDLRNPDCPVGFNPLAGAGEPFIRALHTLDVLASEADSWGVQLEETLRYALLLLAETKLSITDLERLFFDRRFRLAILGGCEDEAVTSFWTRFDELSPDRKTTLATPCMNKTTGLLAVPILRKVLSHPAPLELGGILSRKGSVVLVSLAVDELHRSSRMFGSLMVSSISREMMARVNLAETDRNPVRLYIDEFENMATESFEGLIAEGRRFGFTLVLSHQVLAQLPVRLRSVIRNNVGLQVLFQCGFEDARIVARELPEGIEAHALRSLEAGEAFLMRRDGSACRVQFHKPTKTAVNRLAAEYRERLMRPTTPLAKPTDVADDNSDATGNYIDDTDDDTDVDRGAMEDLL